MHLIPSEAAYTDRVSRAAQAVSATVLLLHVAAAVAAMMLAPQGFPPTSLLAWTSTFIPASSVVVTVAVLVRYVASGARRGRRGTSALVAAAAGGWAAAAATGAVLFPVSMPPSRWSIAASVASAMLALAWWARERAAVTALATLAGAPLGAALVFAQRAPLPTTRPSGGALADVRGTATNDDAATGQLVASCGRGALRIKPLLTFESRSPDRTWTLLAPPSAFGPRRTPTRYVKTQSGFRAAYTDDGESTLVATRDRSGGLDVEGISRLPHAVYAHLDTWTAIHFHFDASVSFGPTAPARFPIEPADSPAGRPAQLAYLAEDLTFHVVRARDAEKGPYTELASGRLGRDEPLVVEIRPRDEKDKGCRLVFRDWSAQLSTDPSPTAGWGVPQGSIQFFSQNGESFIGLTLADTGPGRGWASVGHAEGTYRNRLRVEPIR